MLTSAWGSEVQSHSTAQNNEKSSSPSAFIKSMSCLFPQIQAGFSVPHSMTFCALRSKNAWQEKVQLPFCRSLPHEVTRYQRQTRGRMHWFNHKFHGSFSNPISLFFHSSHTICTWNCLHLWHTVWNPTIVPKHNYGCVGISCGHVKLLCGSNREAVGFVKHHSAFLFQMHKWPFLRQ